MTIVPGNGRQRLFLAFAFALLWAGPAAAAEDASQPPVQVKGDSVEYFHEQQKVVGVGHVKIDTEDTHLEADKITVFMATNVAVAEGNVVLTQKGSIFKGERGEYDFNKKAGNVEGMRAEIPPSLYARAKRVEKAPDGRYIARDAYVTTCCGDNPFYRVQARELEIIPGQKVIVKNATILIKGIPILFVPIYVQKLFDFDRFPVQIIPGKNSEWGAFVLTKWRYGLVDRPDLQTKGNILVDYREKRGFGGGIENFYRGDQFGRGAVRFFYTNDKDGPEFSENGRYRTQWRHQMKLGEWTTLTSEFNDLSDETVIKDFFFREEYERDTRPDTYVSIITATPDYTLSVLDRERVDDFFSTVERSPEVRFDTRNKRFGDTPFYLRQEAQFSNLKKEFGRSEMQEDALRMDLNHTLRYAGHVGSWSVTPRVGTRQTYYSRDLDSKDDQGRGIFDAGVDISTHFFKTHDVTVKRWGLDWNGLRHIFSPTASYGYRPNPTVSRSTLAQFDALDALDKQNVVRFNLVNKLQTKYHPEPGSALVTREMARVIPFFDYDAHTGRLDNVGYDVELRPYTWLGIESDLTYETREGKVTTANFDVLANLGRFDVGVGQRFVRDNSSQTTAELKWRIDSAHTLRLYERYEFNEKHSEETEVTISKAFECVIVDLTYNHRRDDGDSFFFVFRLKGYPAASFNMSQTYNRPKSYERGTL